MSLAVGGRLRVRDARCGHWSNEGKSAFSELLMARDAFISAQDSALDLGGTDRGAVVVASEEAQRKAFLALLQRADAGKLVDIPSARARSLGARLNETWRRLKATPDADSPYRARLADIQTAQRAWLRYRDAWIATGKVRYPKVSADTWIATLTEQRNKQLAEVLAAR